MADARTVHRVLMDMESLHLDLHRLGLAVEIIGTHAKAEGLSLDHGGAVEVLGEVVGERVKRLDALLAEGHALRREGAHG